MFSTSLLSPIEVIDLAKISKEFAPTDVQSIKSVELNSFNDCLSIEFYNSLIAALVDYTGTLQYNSLTQYAISDLVTYNGRNYIALANNQNVIPFDSALWQIAPKFTDNTLNDLWLNGCLGRWLSLLIANATIPFTAIQVTNKGLVKNFGEGYQAASSTDVNNLQIAFNTNAKNSLFVSKQFITANPQYTWVGLNLVEGCGCNNKTPNCERTSGGYSVC